MSSPQEDTDRFRKAAKKSVDYLYKIDGDITDDQYEAIDRLRQLINEEFVGKNKTISSQIIYEILKGIL